MYMKEIIIYKDYLNKIVGLKNRITYYCMD